MCFSIIVQKNTYETLQEAGQFGFCQKDLPFSRLHLHLEIFFNFIFYLFFWTEIAWPRFVLPKRLKAFRRDGRQPELLRAGHR